MFSGPFVILGGISLSARNQTTWTAVDSPRSQSQGEMALTDSSSAWMNDSPREDVAGSLVRLSPLISLLFFFFLHAHRHHMSHPSLEQTCIKRCKSHTRAQMPLLDTMGCRLARLLRKALTEIT